MAEDGTDLDAVALAAREVARAAVSMGMSLDTRTVPGSSKEARIVAGRAEMGLGIHGEAGIEQVGFSGARAAVAMMAARLMPHLGEGPHVAMLNDLGATTALEMGVLAGDLARSPLGARIGWTLGPAGLVTSLDTHGFSVSLLPATAPWVAALAAPAVPAGLEEAGPVAILPLPDGLTPIQPVP